MYLQGHPSKCYIEIHLFDIAVCSYRIRIPVNSRRQGGKRDDGARTLRVTMIKPPACDATCVPFYLSFGCYMTNKFHFPLRARTALAATGVLLISISLAGCVTTSGNQPATQRGAFGVPQEKVEVSGANYIKGEQKVVIGSFRVAFAQKVSESARSSTFFSTDSQSAAMSGTLLGLDHADYQAITDAAYADFVARLKATGLQVVEPAQLRQSAAYSGMAAASNPQLLDSSTTGNVLLMAPSGMKLAMFPGEGGVSSAFSGFDTSNPMRVVPALIKEQSAGVMNVTYYIDFLNTRSSGDTLVTGGDAEVSMGQGLSVRPGSGIAYTTLKGSQCVGYCPNNTSSIKLGQALFSQEPYGTTRNVTEGAVNALGIVSGLLTGQGFARKDLEIQADPVRYRAIADKLLAEANTTLIQTVQKSR